MLILESSIGYCESTFLSLVYFSPLYRGIKLHAIPLTAIFRAYPERCENPVLNLYRRISATTFKASLGRKYQGWADLVFGYASSSV